MLSRSLIVQAAVAVGPALAALNSVSCPVDGPLSCQNTTSIEDTCCFNHPGGQVLLTQFWDTSPSTGPEDAWTIHGLWPDNCDGTYEQYCNPAGEYFNITTILSEAAPSTLQYMQDFWKDYNGDDEDFWEHEFNKHGTCMSTLETKCYPNYESGQEVVDYFKQTVNVFKGLPSYEWLAEAGIVPSSTATYTLARIQAALRAHHGQDVIINCKSGRLNELWYHYNVQGSVQSGNYVPAVPVGSPSTCPATGIRYLPKYVDAPPPTPTSSAPPTPAPSGVPSGKGRLYVQNQDGTSNGFLISGGKWYRAGGTPATYTATPDASGSTFTLTTSKGKCAVQSDSSLLCADSVTSASSFAWDGSFLTYDGAGTFYATEQPAGTAQGTVYTTSKAVPFKVTWTAS